MKAQKYQLGIVEDNRVIGEFLLSHLQRNPDYEVRLFQSGEALLKENQYEPDVLVLDFHLDSEDKHAMNGIQVALRMKNVPIVVLSSQKDISRAVDFIHHGACDYILKDDQAFMKVESSVRKIVKHLNDQKEIKFLKRKSIKDLQRMVLVMSLVALVVFIITLL